MLTKKLIYQGDIIPVKQCMPEGMEIEVETVDLDNQSADEPMRTKRWLFNVRTAYSTQNTMILLKQIMEFTYSLTHSFNFHFISI